MISRPDRRRQHYLVMCLVCLDELAVTQVDGTFVGKNCVGKM